MLTARTDPLPAYRRSRWPADLDVAASAAGEVCRARCSTVISTPFRDGTAPPAGSSPRTGVSSDSRPATTVCASARAVNVLVMEPISNVVSASAAGPPAARNLPMPPTRGSPSAPSWMAATAPTWRRPRAAIVRWKSGLCAACGPAVTTARIFCAPPVWTHRVPLRFRPRTSRLSGRGVPPQLPGG